MIRVVTFEGLADGEWVLSLADLQALGAKHLAENPTAVDEAGEPDCARSTKLARHLLDIAQPARGAGPLVAHISQAALADAVGTSREVVVRVLRDLRVAGLVETGRDGVVLLAPERLHEESWPTTP